MKPCRHFAGLLCASLLCGSAAGQFRDDFNGAAIQDWSYRTGDGAAKIDFSQGDGFGRILVDATADKRGIWWAILARNVSPSLDLAALNQPGRAICVEARIRSSHAPRRVNLSLNTQRTRDFHKDLMEFDIGRANEWEVISFTDPELDVRPGDRVTAQLALMDWGLGKYEVDVDYFQVEVVEVAKAGPDKGTPLPYRPEIADPSSFRESVAVSQDSMVDLQFPTYNFNRWYASDSSGKEPVVTVSGTQWPILRWDLARYKGRQAAGSGLLELTLHSAAWPEAGMQDWGGVRVTEIIGGDPAWDEATVTLDRLTGGKPLDEVVNSQMIIDIEVAEHTLPVAPGSKVLVTISQPVLQRLLDGRTLGIALRPLGPTVVSFFAKEFETGRLAARLLFNVR